VRMLQQGWFQAWPLIFLLCLLVNLSGCSSGRAVSATSQTGSGSTAHPATCTTPPIALDLPATATHLEQQNALFVHPGMVWISDRWDAGPIVFTGNLLREEGYASRVVVVKGRDPALVLEQMLSDPGTQFVGLHYSMGGNSALLAKTFDAARQASVRRSQQLRYHAVLIDPYDIAGLGEQVDLSRPEVGRLLFVLSKENSLLRGRVSALSEAVNTSPKVNFVYAEDVGENWGHFSILPSGRVVGQSATTGQSGGSARADHKTMVLLRTFMAIAQDERVIEVNRNGIDCLVAKLRTR